MRFADLDLLARLRLLSAPSDDEWGDDDWDEDGHAADGDDTDYRYEMRDRRES